MKKVIAGCIDLMLEFDSASELDRYIADIVAKKQEYSIVERKEYTDSTIKAHSQQQKVVRSNDKHNTVKTEN